MLKLAILAVLVVAIAGRSIGLTREQAHFVAGAARKASAHQVRDGTVNAIEPGRSAKSSTFYGFDEFEPVGEADNGVLAYWDEPSELEEDHFEGYHFDYQVSDSESANYYGQTEDMDESGVVKGEYYVNLPDGRTQIVTYVTDRNGYHASVVYKGQASFDNPKEAAEHRAAKKESQRTARKSTTKLAYRPISHDI